MDFDLPKSLAQNSDSRIVLLVIDGLGGLPREPGGLTALEAAYTPHLDTLAAESICGLHEPVAPGITSGSGPAHLALFGYDPLKYRVGRGVLSALGIDFDLQAQDVAARGNFCTLDENGKVTDRRAGRIPTELNRELCELLRSIELPTIELFVETVKEYRLLLVLRGDGLSGALEDTDPQATGEAPNPPTPRDPGAEKTSRLVGKFLTEARRRLADRKPANMVLLRGFSQLPDWPTVEAIYGLKPAAIAAYPMYRGVAKLAGMTAYHRGSEMASGLDVLEETWEDFDFFFVHIKHTDSAGEDGDFDRKRALLEEVDGLIPRLRRLGPDVLVVTGDHSTPAALKSHSWHPVPALLWSQNVRPDRVKAFGERDCIQGGLGPRFPATDLMPMAVAEALRLRKFGA